MFLKILNFLNFLGKIPILKEFEWFEWFEWFGPSPIEPFNSAGGGDARRGGARLPSWKRLLGRGAPGVSLRSDLKK